MFGIGYQEMFIVLVVAMIIFGPSRLPELAGQVGRWVRDFRRMSSDLTGEFEKTFAEVDEVKKSFKRELDSIQSEVEGVGKSTQRDLKRAAAKPATSAKKTPAALKAGTTAEGQTGSGVASGSRAKMPALEPRQRSTRAATNGDGGITGKIQMATKADPLVDVSRFDSTYVPGKNGNSAVAIEADVDDDALSRVRRRRAAASYARRVSA